MGKEFRLPELGENIETIQVVKVRVKVGDRVQAEQPVLELETDKATVEVPSNEGGTVTAVHVSEGQEIRVGDLILSFEGAAADAAPAPAKTGDSGSVAEKSARPESPRPVDASAPAPAPAAPAPAVPGGAAEFRLPELGENIETIQVVKVMVAPGDAVAKDQPVLELETDKATVEVPSTVAGTVTAVHVRAGEEIRANQLILTLKDSPVDAGAAGATAQVPPVSPGLAAEGDRPATPAGDVDEARPAPREDALAPAVARSGGLVPAAPSVRRFAREIGIEISAVPGSGPRGRVSVEDVKTYARSLNRTREGASRAEAAVLSGTALPALPNFEKWGEVQRDRMSVIRRKTADRMALSWATIPHVTIFDRADITELEALRKRFASRAEEAGGKLTMAVMVVKVVAQALKVFSTFNASIDMARREVVYKKYIHVGVAVTTERGLVVPVIRNTDRKNMIQIAVEIAQLAERARLNKLTVDEMEGGTFTVSNLGRICGTYFTPIINHPEVAILGIGRALEETNAQGERSLVLPLSLSFDHRLIDGADGARFLGWIVEAIQQPLLLSLEG